MAELDSGTMIDGRYRVLSRLGSGGMADVFLAEDEQLGRKIALKLLHRRFAEDPGFVERFRREAQSAAGLQHPNVVSVFDRGAYDGTYYIAMEYLPGLSLKALIRQEAPLDPVRAIDVAIQILKAARFAHRRGVIHRDLKPHNVIVDDTGHAKVTDFGIARAGASDMTETGSIMGTAQYLSPEQAQGHAVSACSDLYSVGVVLYEMLTGRVPFDAESPVTIALHHVSEPPPPPSLLNPAVPPELESVVLWALAKDPGARPPDADTFISALEQVRQHIVSAGLGEQTASMPVLDEAALAEAPLLAEAPIADELAPAVVPAEEAAAAEPALAARRRSRRPWIAALLVLLLLGGAALAYVLTRPDQKVVPNVVRETSNVAIAQLENDGFNPTVNNETFNAPAGTVIRQSPVGGTKANVGSTVTLTVSQGPGNVAVPPVDDLPLGQAKATLRKLGLKFRLQRTASNTVPSGLAIRTDPGAGLSVPIGSTVTLFVSTGKPQATVPDVGGLSQADATSKLQAAGFTVSTSTRPSSSASPGTVVGQSPAAGTQAAVGSSVNIVLAAKPTPGPSPGPATTQVPSVKGMTVGQANSTLSAAGFNVVQQPKKVTNPNKDGIVLSQSPAGGSAQKKGSTVTIVVGRFASPGAAGTGNSGAGTANTGNTGP